MVAYDPSQAQAYQGLLDVADRLIDRAGRVCPEGLEPEDVVQLALPRARVTSIKSDDDAAKIRRVLTTAIDDRDFGWLSNGASAAPLHDAVVTTAPIARAQQQPNGSVVKEAMLELRKPDGSVVKISKDPTRWPSKRGNVGFVPLSALELWEKQPRQIYVADSIERLSDASHGPQPEDIIVVFIEPGRYSVNGGHRRTLAYFSRDDAANLAVCIRVEEYKDEAQRFCAAFLMNSGGRESMSDMDTALGLRRLQEDYGLETQAEVARFTGMEPALVGKLFAIADLPEEILALMNPNRPREQRLMRDVAVEISRASITGGAKSSLAFKLLKYHGDKAVTRQLSWLRNEIQKVSGESRRTRTLTPEAALKQLHALLASLANETGFLGRISSSHLELVQAVGGTKDAAELLGQLDKATAALTTFRAELANATASVTETLERAAPTTQTIFITAYFDEEGNLLAGKRVSSEEYVSIIDSGRMLYQRKGGRRPPNEPDVESIRRQLNQ